MSPVSYTTWWDSRVVVKNLQSIFPRYNEILLDLVLLSTMSKILIFTHKPYIFLLAIRAQQLDPAPRLVGAQHWNHSRTTAGSIPTP